MRKALPFTLLLLAASGVHLAEAQTARPQFRPAVLGSGPDSLVRRISASELAQNGQKDGSVMFAMIVAPTGQVMKSWTYRGTPGTTTLEQELVKKMQNLKVAPAIYNYQPVGVLLEGTVVFATPPARQPAIGFFLNQDTKEVAAAHDFIAPQPIIGGDSKFDGLKLPAKFSIGTPVTAIVDLGLKVDKNGELQQLRIVAEDPPHAGYGEAARDNLRDAKFIPAFRDGDPDASDTIFPVCYKAGQ